MGINETDAAVEEEKEEETYADKTIKDKDMLEIMKDVSQHVDGIFFAWPVYEAVRNSYTNYNTKYRGLKMKEFVFLFRLESLVSRGMITEEERQKILEIRRLSEEVADQYSELDRKIREAKRGQRNISDNELASTQAEAAALWEKVEFYDQALDNYHLDDDLDLASLLAMSVRIDDINIDLDSYLEHGKGTKGEHSAR